MYAEEVLERFVEEGRDDHVGLWQIVRAVREDLKVHEECDVRRTTLALVGQLLGRYGMSAGVPAADGRGFLPWTLSADESLQRIETEWLALGRDPDLWEVVWFDTPGIKSARND
jgi:hypothetical protein